MPRVKCTNPATTGLYDAEVMGDDHRTVQFGESGVSRYEVSEEVAEAMVEHYPSVEFVDADANAEVEDEDAASDE